MARISAPRRRKPPQLEEIIDAFTHPLLDRSTRGSAGWKSYFALIAGINNSPEFGGVPMTKTFAPAAQRFIEAIRRVLCERSVARTKRPARRKVKR